MSIKSLNGGLPAGLSGDRFDRGVQARWNENTNWVDRDGLPIRSPVLIIGQAIALRRWKDNQPETITVHPLPDPAKLNSAIPMTEWQTGPDGNPRPPWALIYATYFIEPNSATLYTYANSTFGAKLAHEQLEEQIGVMRMLRNELVYPIVNLEKRPMKTRFGMKSRPHFHIVDWRAPGSGSPLAHQPPSPQLSGPTTTPAPAPATPASSTLDHMKPVKPVTVAELINDELPPWA